MQRFELVEGKSSKFWEISRRGCSYTVRYGRIGSNGQALDKTAASEAKAEAEVEKLIREKTGKGYVEVVVAAGGAAPPVAVKPPRAAPVATTLASVISPTPASAAEPIAAEVARTPNVVQTPSAANPEASIASLSMPSSEFRFSAAWRKALPAQRGYPVHGTLPTLQSQWARLHGFARTERGQWEWAVRNLGIEAMVQRHPPATLLTQASLGVADPQPWQVAFQLGRVMHDANWRAAGGLLVELCVELHGVVFASEQFLRGMSQLPDSARTQWFYTGELGIDELNAALARCADADYAQARAAAAHVEQSSDTDRFIRGAVFNSEAAWIGEALQSADSSPSALGSLDLLAGARLTLAQADSLAQAPAMRRQQSSVRLALNVIRLHGAAALPVVARLFDVQNESEPRRRLAEILRAFDSSDACAALLDRIEHKEARAQIDDFAQAWPFAAMQAAAAAIARSHSKPTEVWLSRMLAAHPPLLEPLRAAVEGAALGVLDRLYSRLIDLEEAPHDALPPVLRDPPWLKPQPKLSRPPLPEAAPPATRMQWPDRLQDDWRRPMRAHPDPTSNHEDPGRSLDALSVPRPLWPALLAGELTDLGPHMGAIEAHRASATGYLRHRYLRVGR